MSLASLLAAAHVWHYWIGVLLAIVTILVAVGTVAAYFFKVTRARYPRK